MLLHVVAAHLPEAPPQPEVLHQAEATLRLAGQTLHQVEVLRHHQEVQLHLAEATLHLVEVIQEVILRQAEAVALHQEATLHPAGVTHLRVEVAVVVQEEDSYILLTKQI